jgi:hypothetical protein
VIFDGLRGGVIQLKQPKNRKKCAVKQIVEQCQRDILSRSLFFVCFFSNSDFLLPLILVRRETPFNSTEWHFLQTRRFSVEELKKPFELSFMNARKREEEFTF